MIVAEQFNDDMSSDFMQKSESMTRDNSIRETEDWLRTFEESDKSGSKVFVEPLAPRGEVKQRPLPEPKPLRRATDDPLGRPEPGKGSAAGTVMRNLGEIPGQAAGGVEDALTNAGVFGLIDPLAQWLNDNVIDLRYGGIDKANTVTGSISRKVTEFLTGFIPALRAMRAVGVTGAVTGPIAAGAVADFVVRDPHEGRLFDLWNEAGLPKNVLTDYMSSDPTDSQAEARFKNSLEGVGMGLAFEGVFKAAQVLRAARATPGVKESEEAILKAKYGETPDAEFKKVIGDPSKPAIEISVRKPPPIIGKIRGAIEKTPDLAPRALIRGKRGTPLPEDWEVYINFARIDEPKQVQFVIGKMAEAMKSNIDEAARGTITHKATQEMADDLGMTVPELLARRKGQAFNAEEALASRQLWLASGEELLRLAKAAAGPNAGPLDQFAFRRQMAVHSAIQAEVLGARTEAGRALSSWNIVAKGGMERARAIDQIMKAMGGPEQSRELAHRLALLAENGVHPSHIAKFAQRGWGATTMDAVKEIWVNGLLSSPKTHAVNIMSNTLVAFQQIYERGAAGAIRSFTGGEGVQAGEAAAMAFGMVESLKDAFRMVAKALKTGESGAAFNKIDLPRAHSVSPEAFRMSRETGLGRAIDYIGTTVNIPGRLLVAEDEFFKTIGYRMELRAQALRMAKSENLTGDALKGRVVDILNNPPEHITINAADAALYNTFTSEVGWFGRGVMNLRNADHPLNPMMFALPFVRTPVNIARYAFERTPFAPLVGQWRADIAAGGARADLALARMSTGTAIMLVAMDMADKGLISGDGPRGEDKEIREALQRQGWQNYSAKVGDKWYSFNRADPFGMTIGFAASITEAVRRGEIDEDDVDEWYEVTAMAIAAVSQVAVSKTYLEGFAKFIEVMSDPKRYSEAYVKDLFSSFLPATSLNSAVKNFIDPIQREAGTPLEAMQARIAGLSDKLPPRRTLWGEPITSASGMGSYYDLLSPIGVKQQVDSPIDKEIVRVGAGPDRIKKRTVFDGVEVNLKPYPEVYDAYTRLAGNELKHPAWGMGAKAYLDAVVSGKHPMSTAYKFMSDETRREFIANTVSDYRRLAQQQILADPKFKNFAAEVRRLKEINMGSKMPVLE